MGSFVWYAKKLEENLKYIAEFLPEEEGWLTRLYVDSSVPAEFVRYLMETYNVEVRWVQHLRRGPHRDYLVASIRPLILDDPSITRFICLDCHDELSDVKVRQVLRSRFSVPRAAPHIHWTFWDVDTRKSNKEGAYCHLNGKMYNTEPCEKGEKDYAHRHIDAGFWGFIGRRNIWLGDVTMPAYEIEKEKKDGEGGGGELEEVQPRKRVRRVKPRVKEEGATGVDAAAEPAAEPAAAAQPAAQPAPAVVEPAAAAVDQAMPALAPVEEKRGAGGEGGAGAGGAGAGEGGDNEPAPVQQPRQRNQGKGKAPAVTLAAAEAEAEAEDIKTDMPPPPPSLPGSNSSSSASSSSGRKRSRTKRPLPDTSSSSSTTTTTITSRSRSSRSSSSRSSSSMMATAERPRVTCFRCSRRPPKVIASSLGTKRLLSTLRLVSSFEPTDRGLARDMLTQGV